MLNLGKQIITASNQLLTPKTKKCPGCRKQYTLGINGVDNGCDECEGITRLPNGMIDYAASTTEVFTEGANHD